MARSPLSTCFRRLGPAVISVASLGASFAVTLVLGAAPVAAADGNVNVCPPATRPGYATCFAIQNTGAQPMTAGLPAGYGPADLQSAYNLPSSTGGVGQSVYIVDAYDDPTAASDLALYRSTYGLPECTVANGCFAKLNQSGQTSPLPAYNSGWAGEIALDLAMASAICPNCSIRLIEANDAGGGLYSAVNTAVAGGAKFISMSWGGPEWAQQVTGADPVFDHKGVVFTASTGDNGYAAGVSYPAASPNVVAVGGTRLNRASDSRGWTETAWSGAGSGCSAYEAPPTRQSSLDPSACPRHALADVSAVADPATGVAVALRGGWGVFGGTSASAPIVASIYALAGPPDATDSPADFPYTNVSSLNDVTSGATGSCSGSPLCTAGAGWDGPTGLGTPNGIGAFNGVGSSAPIVTTLGGSVSAITEVPGLPVAVSVTPIIPTGRTLAKIAWTSARADCSFADATVTSTTVTCNANASGTSKVTATLTDSSGATKAVTGTLTFATSGAKRAVTVAMTVDGQADASVAVCTGNAAPIAGHVVDVATGQPVKGVSVAFSHRTGSTGTFAGVGSGVTAGNGTAVKSISATTTGTYGAQALATGVYAASNTLTTNYTVGRCTPALSAELSDDQVWYGNTVTVSGSVVRTGGQGSIPVSGINVTLSVTPPAKTLNGRTVTSPALNLGSASTGIDGTFRVAFKATTPGSVTARIGASPGFEAVTDDVGALTVQVPQTSLQATASTESVMFGSALTISGQLRYVADESQPLSGASVALKFKATGATTTVSLGTARTKTDGTFSAPVTPTSSGVITVAYTGGAAYGSVSVEVGPVTVDKWTPAVTLAASATSIVKGTTVTYSGTLSRTDTSDNTGPAKGVLVKLLLVPSAGGATITLGSGSTTATGTFSIKAATRVSGTVTAVVMSVNGYESAASVGVTVTIQ
jgi:5-hydroxyisourate hydrolase-like protein (transthyretin family)